MPSARPNRYGRHSACGCVSPVYNFIPNALDGYPMWFQCGVHMPSTPNDKSKLKYGDKAPAQSARTPHVSQFMGSAGLTNLRIYRQ